MHRASRGTYTPKFCTLIFCYLRPFYGNLHTTIHSESTLDHRDIAVRVKWLKLQDRQSQTQNWQLGRVAKMMKLYFGRRRTESRSIWLLQSVIQTHERLTCHFFCESLFARSVLKLRSWNFISDFDLSLTPTAPRSRLFLLRLQRIANQIHVIRSAPSTSSNLRLRAAIAIIPSEIYSANLH